MYHDVSTHWNNNLQHATRPVPCSVQRAIPRLSTKRCPWNFGGAVIIWSSRKRNPLKKTERWWTSLSNGNPWVHWHFMTNGSGSSAAKDGEMSRKQEACPRFFFHDFTCNISWQAGNSLPNSIFWGEVYFPTTLWTSNMLKLQIQNLRQTIDVVKGNSTGWQGGLKQPDC